ncbi:MAG TPA: hypothetical protein PLO51_01515, partial [Candidatus Micrarchaeota archaeon]|nr:hypothetical protein [Candidatus Micrarchaeota archaeon]
MQANRIINKRGKSEAMELCKACAERYSESLPARKKKPGTACGACGGIFAQLESACKTAWLGARGTGVEFDTFRVASTVPESCEVADTLMIREKGHAKVTPIKNDINRKTGVLAQKISGKKQGAPGRRAILRLNFRTGAHAFQNENVFVFGRYEKLEAGLSQTKWLCSWCDG